MAEVEHCETALAVGSTLLHMCSVFSIYVKASSSDWLCAGAEGMSFFFVWLRLSTMKQLDWYRNSSYQSKDIAHVQKTITQRIADKVNRHYTLPLHVCHPVSCRTCHVHEDFESPYF